MVLGHFDCWVAGSFNIIHQGVSSTELVQQQKNDQYLFGNEKEDQNWITEGALAFL